MNNIDIIIDKFIDWLTSMTDASMWSPSVLVEIRLQLRTILLEELR